MQIADILSSSSWRIPPTKALEKGIPKNHNDRQHHDESSGVIGVQKEALGKSKGQRRDLGLDGGASEDDDPDD